MVFVSDSKATKRTPEFVPPGKGSSGGKEMELGIENSGTWEREQSRELVDQSNSMLFPFLVQVPE
jgi:hypothetical protein